MTENARSTDRLEMARRIQVAESNGYVKVLSIENLINLTIMKSKENLKSVRIHTIGEPPLLATLPSAHTSWFCAMQKYPQLDCSVCMKKTPDSPSCLMFHFQPETGT